MSRKSGQEKLKRHDKVLLELTLPISMCLGVSFGPVATLVTKYYNIGGDVLDIINLMPWAVNIIGLVFGIYLIGRFKLLKSVRYAATVIFIGGLIRALRDHLHITS